MFTLQNGARVLEVGCGDGLNLYLLAQMGLRHLTGIDQSKIAISRAKKIVPWAQLVVGDAWKLPFKKNSFDAVLVDSVFHILTLSAKPLAQITRVLKPGGYLCFIEPDKSLLRDIFDKLTLSRLGRIIPFLAKRRIVYKEERPLLERWFGYEQQFLEQLAKEGFRKVFVKYDLLSIIGKYQKTR